MKDIKNKKLNNTLIKTICFLGVITYLLFSISSFYMYKSKEREQKQLQLSKEIEGINEKLSYINKFYQILDVRTRYLILSSSGNTTPKNLIEIQNIIKQSNLLGESNGISINVIDLEETRVFNGETIFTDEYIDDTMINRFIRGELEYEKFYSTFDSVIIFKKPNFSSKYPIALSIKKRSLFNSSGKYEIYLKSGEDKIGMEEEVLSIKKMKDFKIENQKFLIREKQDLLEFLIPILLWFLVPILPIVGLYYLIYKIALNYFSKTLLNFWSKISNEESLEEGNKSLDDLYETIVERNSYLMDKVMETEKSFREEMIRNFILGIGTIESIENILKNPNYYCGVINVGSNDYTIEEIFYLTNKISELLKEQCIEGVPLDRETIFLLSETPIDKKAIEGEILNFETKYKMGIFGYVDEKSVTVSEIQNKKREIIKYIEFKDRFNSKIIIDSSDLESRKIKYSYFIPINLEQKLISKINNSSPECSKIILTEIFEENFKNRVLNLENRKKFKRVIVNSFERIVMHLDLVDIFELNKDFFEKKENLSDEIFIEKAYEISDKMSAYSKKNSSQDESLEEKIKKYIQENYQRELSLVDFADYLQVTPQYASSMYKKITGENFNTSLNHYRIEKAIEIFKKEEGKIKIKNLGERVGFYNPITFINNFKKFYGVSPSKYFEISD